MAFVEFEQRGHVGLITINRPEVLNALNLEVIEQLDDILLRAESQEDVHVIVITGAGRSFVAGADIGEMVNYTADDAKRFSHHGNNTMMHITRFPSPVIAAVNGFALGGGCELAMSCDIRVASEKATFGMPEVGLGITPGFGGTQRLQRIVGMSTAMELVLTSRTIDAQEARPLPGKAVMLIDPPTITFEGYQFQERIWTVNVIAGTTATQVQALDIITPVVERLWARKVNMRSAKPVTYSLAGVGNLAAYELTLNPLELTED